MRNFNRKIHIGHIEISAKSPVCIIAEIGLNHNGSLPLAKKLIDAALHSGATAVKFQTFRTDEFMSDKRQMYAYGVAGKRKSKSLYSLFKKLELPYSWHKELLRYSKKKGIQFLSTPCDKESVDLLIKLGVPAIKISSEDLININLLEYVARKNIPVILSTGMADELEIDTAVRVFKKYNHRDLILLHCTSIYPTPNAEANLRRIVSLRKKYGVLSGYSDHTDGCLASLGAVFLGAKIIEKHFTLSRKMDGPDHSFSCEPNDLKKLILNIRICEELSGSGEIIESKSEKILRLKYRRSIVASRDLKSGTRLTEFHLAYKRPGDGLRPIDKDEILGKKLTRDIRKDQKILLQEVC